MTASAAWSRSISGEALTTATPRSSLSLSHARLPEPPPRSSPRARSAPTAAHQPADTHGAQTSHRKPDNYLLSPICCPQTQNVCEPEQAGLGGAGRGGTEHARRLPVRSGRESRRQSLFRGERSAPPAGQPGSRGGGRREPPRKAHRSGAVRRGFLKDPRRAPSQQTTCH